MSEKRKIFVVGVFTVMLPVTWALYAAANLDTTEASHLTFMREE